MDDPTHEQRRIHAKVFWLVLAVVALLSIVTLFLDRAQGWRTLASSLGVNLLAAVLFAAFFTLLLDREARGVLREELSDQFKLQTGDLLKALDAYKSEYAPSHVFEAKNGFDRGFLMAFSTELREASNFWFRGSAGKFLAPYISALGIRDLSLRVLLLDPRDGETLQMRARDMEPRMSEAARAVRVEELQRDVYRTIVALHDVKGSCGTLEIGFAPLTSVTRLECLDGSAYLGVHAAGQRYPDILRFPVGSRMFEVFHLEVARQIRASRPVNILAISSDVALIELLADMGMPHAEAGLAGLREESRRFDETFRRRCRDEAGLEFGT